jgi:hypothetical protein
MASVGHFSKKGLHSVKCVMDISISTEVRRPSGFFHTA